MTQEQILEKAKEAGFDVAQWAINGGIEVVIYEEGPITEQLERFAALVAVHEREKQAEQEPVGWYSHKGGFNECGEGQPLYAAPVRTKNLTDDDIRAMFNGYVAPETLLMFRAVIAADREKNK